MAQQISIEELKLTDAYKGHKGLTFPHPNTIIDVSTTEVLRHYENAEFEIVVDKESGAKDENQVEIITWGRGVITATLPMKIGTNLVKYVIGLIWQYDTKAPRISIFRGVSASACTNLCIFEAEDIKKYNLNYKAKNRNETKERWNKIWDIKLRNIITEVIVDLEEFVTAAEEHFETYLTFIDKLNETKFVGSQITKLIGGLYITFPIQGNFDISTFNMGCSLLFIKDYLHSNSELYYTGHVPLDAKENPKEVSAWTLYNAFTQRITDADGILIDDIADKTLEVTNMIKTII